MEKKNSEDRSIRTDENLVQILHEFYQDRDGTAVNENGDIVTDDEYYDDDDDDDDMNELPI